MKFHDRRDDEFTRTDSTGRKYDTRDRWCALCSQKVKRTDIEAHGRSKKHIAEERASDGNVRPYTDDDRMDRQR